MPRAKAPPAMKSVPQRQLSKLILAREMIGV